ncbi:MAG: ABC transporter ATP-binding protein [Methylobacteriaceae bacterium]|nr:ABC transporter ATP-binding protein [Methylobacteriaceae bacterium]MBV9244523.1 ABC transporter ATP-binding protein [Methylobacteriaceae bacterium]
MPRVEFNRICKTYADGTRAVVDLDLAVADREFLCVLGPSGCGKSSTLRMLAGLESISSGDLVLDGRRINDVPPQARDMAMVFENYALYPHLRVFENIAMPLVARRRPRAEIRERVQQVAETLQIVEYLRQRPQTLSGGQRQRVALGRAIVRRPKMFLMDEPLGHLEAYLRVQLRAELRRLHERLGATTIYITHDQEEAEAVSDRIAVMENGRLQQLGGLVDLLDRPINRFVAEFIGRIPINMLPARLAGDGQNLQVGAAMMPLSGAQSAKLRSGGTDPLTLGIRPEHVALSSGSAGETISGLSGRVRVIEPQGDSTVIIADTPAGRVSALVPSGCVPSAGEVIELHFAMDCAHVFGADNINLLRAARNSE